MPMISVRYVSPAPASDLRSEIAACVAHLSTVHLRKDPAVTAVLVEPADPGAWFIAGRPPARAGQSAFWLDIKVTAGTNTKAETTAFVRAAHDALAALLGTTNEESYALVHAVDGDAYGFGGRTQNGRWSAANPG